MPWINLLSSAEHLYDNSASGLTAAKVQEAIDELAARDVFYPSGFYDGVPTASQVLMHIVSPGAVSFPSGLTGSQGYAEVAATAQTDFDIQKNGSSVGTMRFAAAGTVASFIAASPFSLAAGDRIKIIAPATPDSTLAGLAFTLAGAR